MTHWFSDLRPFRRDPLGFLLRRGCGAQPPLVRLWLGPNPVWLVTDADLVKDILKASEDQIDKGRFIHKLRPVMGHSSLTFSGPEHRRRRGALHATFAKGTAQQYVPQMSAVIRELAARLAPLGTFNAHDVTAPLTLRMICIVMFGKDVLSGGDLQAIVHAVGLVEDDLADELFQVLPPLPWTAARRRRKRAEARMIMDLIVRRVRDRAPSSSALKALEQLGLSDTDIRDEIVTMLLAGHHTTGSAATWVLYYLATRPELASRIAREARELSDANGELKPEALARAQVSLALVREVLRLYPSAFWFSRDTRARIVLGGVTLNAGDAIIISPWQLHRDPRYWEAPNEFDIARVYSGRAYLPFGVGPRACLGMGIAMLELQLLALEIAAAFTLELHSPYPAPLPTPSVTLIPPRIDLSLHVREPVSSMLAAE